MSPHCPDIVECAWVRLKGDRDFYLLGGMSIVSGVGTQTRNERRRGLGMFASTPSESPIQSELGGLFGGREFLVWGLLCFLDLLGDLSPFVITVRKLPPLLSVGNKTLAGGSSIPFL